MSVTYRIYTEDKNRAGIVKAITSKFESFTLFEGTGYWQGNQERSLVIEIVTPCHSSLNAGSDRTIQDIATEIKFINQQQAVIITKSSTHYIEI